MQVNKLFSMNENPSDETDQNKNEHTNTLKKQEHPHFDTITDSHSSPKQKK